LIIPGDIDYRNFQSPKSRSNITHLLVKAFKKLVLVCPNLKSLEVVVHKDNYLDHSDPRIHWKKIPQTMQEQFSCRIQRIQKDRTTFSSSTKEG